MDCVSCPKGAKEMFRLIALGMPPKEAAERAIRWLAEITPRGCVANARIDGTVINPLKTTAIKTSVPELAR